MEVHKVPIAYTEGLKEIYFTLLPSYSKGRVTSGDYDAIGKIRLSCDTTSRDSFDRNLIHELAHHVDEMEGISDRESIIEEKRTSARHIPDAYARKDVSEYVAVGFEIYYFGTRTQRGELRRQNPKLYNVIRYIHRKYSAK